MPSAQTAGDALTGRRDLLKLAAFLGVGLVTPVARAAMAAPEPWSPDRRALIADIAETIIPATDTGGAKAAGVPAFIEMMVADWFNPAERTHFMDGMAVMATAHAQRMGSRSPNSRRPRRTIIMASSSLPPAQRWRRPAPACRPRTLCGADEAAHRLWLLYERARRIGRTAARHGPERISARRAVQAG